MTFNPGQWTKAQINRALQGLHSTYGVNAFYTLSVAAETEPGSKQKKYIIQVQSSTRLFDCFLLYIDDFRWHHPFLGCTVITICIMIPTL